MKHTTSTLTRRRFLETTLGGLQLADAINLNAAPTLAGETEHFFYRLAPEGPYIDSQRGNKAFGFGRGKIFRSEDNAKSWAHSAEFPDADKITWSVILRNGNIFFATSAQLFLSTDNLKTHRPITVKKADSWTWKVIVSVNSDSRFKCGGINFVDGRLYWISDANGPKLGLKHDRGIFIKPKAP